MESKQSSRVLVFTVIALLTIVVTVITASVWFAGAVEPGTLIFFDDDLSDSALGWMIAAPILMLTAILVAFVLAGTGVMVVGAIAMAVVATIMAVVFTLLMVFLPFALFIAVPILAIVGLVKLVSKPA